MLVQCPACGDDHIRLARRLSLPERLAEIVGLYTLRCGKCEHRFHHRIWGFRDLFFAKCPRCYHMDLSSWSLRYYNPPLPVRLKLKLGAWRVRCEYCRLNFASFRPVRRPYRWHLRVQRMQGTSQIQEELAQKDPGAN